MTIWPKDELRKIAEADDLHISPFRGDGRTHGTPTWIWSVVVDDALYVRAYNGQNSRRLAQAIAKDVVDILHYGEEPVSVAMEEVKSEYWKEKVYKPDM